MEEIEKSDTEMEEIEKKPEKLKIVEAKDHHRHRRRVTKSKLELEKKQYKRVQLCVAKPSYLLSLGPQARRSDYLNTLPKLLREFLRQRNWSDASGVLSVLMQGTMKDSSPKMNRLKYEAHIQIVINSQLNKNKAAKEIGDIYDTWIAKIGKQYKQERLSVWNEQICHFIENGMDVEAYSTTISMMQKNGDYGTLPRASLFVGISFYKMWCRRFSKEFQSEEADCNQSISDMSVSRSNTLVRDESVYSMESEGSVSDESEASVINYKRTSRMSISDSGTDTVVKVESPQHFTSPPPLYASSQDTEVSSQDRGARTFDPALIQILGDMDPWLLPLKPPEDPDCYVRMVNDSYYKDALRYLRVAVQSPIQVSLPALHPLIQVLLIGGHADEAMKVVNEMCSKVHDIKTFRIKAAMMEKFHSNSDMLAQSYEDVLKIDPTCATTLKKLIAMRIDGNYSRESLIEMIALHVEASFPDLEIWEEFAACLDHMFDNLDEDRMSICLGYGEEQNQQHQQQQIYSIRYNPRPKLFNNTAWTLRAKWWLQRHFSPEMLETEIKKGDLKIMKYKAACARCIYGPEFSYGTQQGRIG